MASWWTSMSKLLKNENLLNPITLDMMSWDHENKKSQPLMVKGQKEHEHIVQNINYDREESVSIGAKTRGHRKLVLAILSLHFTERGYRRYVYQIAIQILRNYRHRIISSAVTFVKVKHIILISRFIYIYRKEVQKKKQQKLKWRIILTNYKL